MKTVAPDTVGFSPQRLGRIRSIMQAYVDQGKLPGAITVVARRGQIAHAECFGWMDLEAKKPMRFDNIFLIYSMTKPITSVAMMMLYEEGRFQLHDPISKFIPEFKDVQVYVKTTETGIELANLEREITIHDLLRHTSGLASGFGEDQPLAKLYGEAGLYRPDSTLQEFSQTLAQLPLLHQPGEAWRYGESYEVLAHLVEVISGMPFATFLKQRIFEPLGMVDTGFGIPKEKRDRLAKFYGVSETGDFAEATEIGAVLPWWIPSNLPRGSVGLGSTASDYLRFAQMLLNGGELDGKRLLGRKTVQYMTQNHLPYELMPIKLSPGFGPNGYGYGLGFGVLTDVVQFEGLGSEGAYYWGGYAGTHFWVDPKEELIGLLMLQIEAFSYMRIAGPSSFFTISDPFRVLTYQAIVD